MNVSAVLDVLPIIVQGWLGTFLVTGVIVAVVALFNKKG